mmetsp:Transcript_20553/g.36964  ORF Transcript_20553/g.36964 Transcript_20553/m.36964 type:complete len:334 (-) Transcript_20553:20-1021(-)
MMDMPFGMTQPQGMQVALVGALPVPSAAPTFPRLQPTPTAAPQSQIYTGTVKSYNPTKGWGHIECEETHKLYGKDIFLLRSKAENCNLAKGARVSFTISQGDKGPEADNVQIAESMELRYTGSIKSWNPVKGWGHIACDETQAIYSKDIFLMRSALAGGQCAQGDQVSFVVVDGTKGPEATDVKVSAPAETGSGGKGARHGMSNRQTYTGQVKLYNAEKGFGYVACEETYNQYGWDIYLTKRRLGGHSPKPGDQLTFTVDFSPDGRPEATNIILQSRYKAERAWQPPPPSGKGKGSWWGGKGGKGMHGMGMVGGMGLDMHGGYGMHLPWSQPY